MTLALMEMVINWVSTRKMAKITEELCKRLDPLVKEWNERPL